MTPRKQLDLTWSDIAFGLRATFTSSPHVPELGDPNLVTTLSVRSGLDALLSVLKLPPGSEVLISAITIRDMLRVIEAHDLVPVPVDLDPDSFEPRLESLTQSRSAQSRTLILTSLFGARIPVEPYLAFAREHDLILVEDLAQGFTGDGFWGAPQADVSMFSFGPIKTATALGGGILHFRDPEFAERVRAHQASWPVQSAREFRSRILRFAMLHFLTQRWTYTAFVRTCQWLGMDHDQVVGRSAKGFGDGELLAMLRHQPAPALRALLKRRLSSYSPKNLQKRVELMTEADALLEDVPRPGYKGSDRSNWLYPILSRDPDRLIGLLLEHGFDATRGQGSQCVVDPPADRPELEPSQARRLFDQIVYLPVHPGLRHGELEHLAAVVTQAERDKKSAEAPLSEIPLRFGPRESG